MRRLTTALPSHYNAACDERSYGEPPAEETSSMMIEILPLNVTEWARLAQDAYRRNENAIGHLYSAAAAMGAGVEIELYRWEALMAGYRAWLMFGFAEAAPLLRAPLSLR